MTMTDPANDTRPILTVSELNHEVSVLLQQGFPSIWIEGEISNLARPASGHLYFSLKDDKAQIRCAMFKGQASKVRTPIENGKKIIARGRIGLYEPRGDYQFVLQSLEDAGEGELQRRFEALKKELATAGWFDEQQKKTLPRFPRHIGIITSPSGAAVRDILNVLKRRCPFVPISIYGTSVQGEAATKEIAQAINQADQDGQSDVLILARGGGSIEDLWCFNEKTVAKAILDCQTPIVSGVGHEVDFTIADFVADLRAPTPSAAAELVSIDAQVLIEQIQRNHQRINNALFQHYQWAAQRVDEMTRRLNNQAPNKRLAGQQEYTQMLSTRLDRTWQQQQTVRQHALHNLQNRLKHLAPTLKMPVLSQRLSQLHWRMEQHINKELQLQQERLIALVGQLEAFSPLSTLNRGYALALTPKGKVIKSIKQRQIGDTLKVRVADGSFDCIVQQAQTEL